MIQRDSIREEFINRFNEIPKNIRDLDKYLNRKLPLSSIRHLIGYSIFEVSERRLWKYDDNHYDLFIFTSSKSIDIAGERNENPSYFIEEFIIFEYDEFDNLSDYFSYNDVYVKNTLMDKIMDIIIKYKGKVLWK